MAKAAAKAAPAKVDTVTLKHIAATLAEAHEIPKKQAIAVSAGHGNVCNNARPWQSERSEVCRGRAREKYLLPEG